MRPNGCGPLVRLAVMPSSPPKKRVSMSEAATTSSPSPSVIMAKTVPARLVVTEPMRRPKKRPPAAPKIGTSGIGTGQPRVDEPHRVDGDVAAEAEVHGVAEGEEPGLAEEHVEREREDGGDAHLAQHASA